MQRVPPDSPLDRSEVNLTFTSMETVSFKAPPGTKKKLARVARQRGETPSRIAWLAVEKELHAGRRGALLGAGKALVSGPSTYDPAAPALAPGEWEMNR